jgi:hypothetical protein
LVGRSLTFLFHNIFSNTLLGLGRHNVLQSIDVHPAHDYFSKPSEKTALEWLCEKIRQHLFRGAANDGEFVER